MSVRGQKLKIIPIFNKENELYENYMGTAIGDFETDLEKYFFYNIGFEGYGIESYYDLLVASYYVITSKNKKDFEYNIYLRDLFFILFPKTTDFEKQLKVHIQNIKDRILYLMDGPIDKNESIEILLSYIKTINDILSKLLSIPENYYHYDYIKVAKDFALQVKELISDAYDVVFICPQNFQYTSTENPLAFFINILYRNGLFELWNEKMEEEMFIGEVDDINTFFDRRFTSEYHISFRLLKDKLKSLPKNSRQSYIDKLCQQLNTLDEKTKKHRIKSEYEYPERPYRWLVYDLKKCFKKFIFLVDFKYDKREETTIITRNSFIKKLLNLNIKDFEHSSLTLFKEKVSDIDFRNLMYGDLKVIPRLYIQWPTETFYYLLEKLLSFKTGLTIAGLHKSKKLYLENTFLFDRHGYDKYKSLLKIKDTPKKKPRYHKEIDILF